MKKCFYAAVCAVAMVSVNVNAQEIEQNQEENHTIDSLQQVVNTLSSQVQDAEREKQDQAIWKKRSKYFGVGYVSQTLTTGDGYETYSGHGVNLTWGKTWYLHKKPILNMIKIGLDWTWMDINYVKYSAPTYKDVYDDDYGYDWTRSTRANGWDDYYNGYYDDYYDDYEDDDLDIGRHQLEYGMQIGPSITINPVHHLKVSTYFRFQPSFSVLLLDDEIGYGFVPFFNFGAAVSWKALSVGVEGRWGKTKYSGFSMDDDDEGYDDSYWEEEDFGFDSFSKRVKIKTFRVYFHFRF